MLINHDRRPNQPRRGTLRTLAPIPRRRRPSAWLLLLPLAALIGWAVWPSSASPTSLAGARLAGARSPAAISVVLWLDESGSFAQYTSLRLRVLDDLAQWAPANLRPADLITVIAFDDTAGFRLRTTSVGELAAHGPTLVEPGLHGSSTDIHAALRLSAGLDTGLPTTIIAVTDTEISALAPAVSDPLIAAMHATTMTTIVPRGVHVTDVWRTAFPWTAVLSADPGDTDATGVALAHALAHATGQHVVRS